MNRVSPFGILAVAASLFLGLTTKPLIGQPLPSGSAKAVAIATDSSSVYEAGGVGVFKSTTGGLTWTNTALPANSSDVNGAASDPTSPATVYVAANDGVFLTTNGGQTWSLPFAGCSYALATVATTPTTIYAGTCGTGVSKSTDGGQTWTTSTNPAIASQVVISLAVDPTNTTTVYAGTNSGVFKSTDGGQTWASFSSGLNSVVDALVVDSSVTTNVWAGSYAGLFVSTNGGQSWSQVSNGLPSASVNAVAFDPFTHSTMYVGMGGTGGFYKSTNGGQSWSASSSGLPTTVFGGVYGIAADHTNACVLYAATFSDTIYKSTNCGTTWSPANVGIQALSIYGIAVDPTNDSNLYVGTHSTGVYRSVDGGVNWSNSGYTGSSGVIWSLALNPTTPATVAAAADNGIYLTTNGGQSWAQTSTYGVIPLTIDPNNSSVMYGGGFQSVLKSTNSGQSWSTYTAGLPSDTVFALAVDPANSSNVYAATLGAGVYKSTDGGQDWAPTATLSQPYLEALSFDRNTPANLYAGSTSGLFKSSNGGQSWSQVAGVPISFITALAFDPSNKSTIYEAGFGGVAKSTDGGNTWTLINSGLQFLYVEPFVIDPSNPNVLYAGLVGGGLYKSTNGGTLWQQIGESTGPPVPTQLSINPPLPTTLPAGGNLGNVSIAVENALGNIVTSSNAVVNLVVKVPITPTILYADTFQQTAVNGVATFPLAGIPFSRPGVYDISATSPGLTEADANVMVNATPCTVSFSPGSADAGSPGDLGLFTVTAPSFCTWMPIPNEDWISIFPGALLPFATSGGLTSGSSSVTYSVLPNNSVASRSGTISVDSSSFDIFQAGFTCNFALAPDAATLSASGGTTYAVVITQAGCSWTARSNGGWLRVVSGASGNGAGRVQISAAANTGAARTGTLTIAGQTFTVTQSAPTPPEGAPTYCGATSVPQVTVQYQPATVWPPVPTEWNQTYYVHNGSSTEVTGPLYMVMVGLVGAAPYPLVKQTFCFSSNGDYIVDLGITNLAPGQTILDGSTFFAFTLTSVGIIQYRPVVLSSLPSR